MDTDWIVGPLGQAISRQKNYRKSCFYEFSLFEIDPRGVCKWRHHLLTLISMREGTFHPLSFLYQILSAEFLSKISKLVWIWKLASIGLIWHAAKPMRVTEGYWMDFELIKKFMTCFYKFCICDFFHKINSFFSPFQLRSKLTKMLFLLIIHKKNLEVMKKKLVRTLNIKHLIEMHQIREIETRDWFDEM